jgi:hypothetical protein
VSPRRPAVFQIPTAVETMMQLLFTIRRNILVTTFLAALFVTHTAHAASQRAAIHLPVLWAKSWLIGYALLFVGILLGLLAVLIPSMRKVLRKRDV